MNGKRVKSNNGISRIPEDYQDLLSEICDYCASSKKIPDKNSTNGGYVQIWEGKVFHDFILRSKDLRDDLKAVYEKRMDITFQTFYVSDSSGIKPSNAEKIFYLAADVYDCYPTAFLREFVHYCNNINNFEHRAFRKHKDAISRLIKDDLVRLDAQSQLTTIQDHLSVNKEIERIKENNGFYPYGKERMGSKVPSRLSISLKDVDHLLEIIPEHVLLLALKCQILTLLGQEDQAYNISEKLYVREPHNVKISEVHMSALNKLGKKEEALEVGRKAKVSNEGMKNPVLIVNIGVCLIQMNKYQEAIEEFKEAIRLDDRFIAAYYYLAASYQQIRQYKQSEVILKKALRITPDETKLIEGLIGVLKQQGKHDEANALIKNINHNELSEYKSGHLKAVAAFEENKFIESIEIMTELIRKQEHDDFVTDKDRARAFLDLAFFYDAQYVKDNNRERYSLAKHYYEKSLEYNPEFSTALFKAAFFCLGDKEYEKCEQYLDRLEKTNNFEYINAKRIEEVYMALAVLAKNHLPEIDYKILFKWSNEKYPGNMEYIIGQIHVYFEDKNYQGAKDFINNLHLNLGSSSDNEGITNLSKTIQLVSDALNSIDVEKLNSGDYFTEEYLKVLEACTTDEVKKINRDFWLNMLHSKCECLLNLGLKDKDIERLQEAIPCYEKLLKETLAHQDIDKWRMINIEIGDVYNALWVNSGDVTYLEKGIEYVSRLLLDTDVDSDRYSWLIFAKFLAPRCLELYKEKSNREHLDEALKLFEAVFRENEEMVGYEKIEPGIFLKAGDAYIELDKLELDIKYLERAETYYRSATVTEVPELLYDANFSIATTLQDMGIRTDEHEKLIEALTIVKNFRDAVSRRSDPDVWAHNHAWMAEIKYQIGVINHDLNQFLDSAKAYKEAFDLRNRKGISIEDHVYWKHGRGLSLLKYCEANDSCKTGLINDAIKCFLSELDILKPDEAPWEYANARDRLGDAYLWLGRRKGNMKHIKMALDAFRDAYATFDKYSYLEHVPELSEKIESLKKELEME